jgi:hypothetical protein
MTIDVRGKTPNVNSHIVRLAKNSFISPVLSRRDYIDASRRFVK